MDKNFNYGVAEYDAFIGREYSKEEIAKDEAWSAMSNAIKHYWAVMSYGRRNGPEDIYSEYKHDILNEVVREFSDTIFDATDGWLRPPEDKFEITDQSGDN